MENIQVGKMETAMKILHHSVVIYLYSPVLQTQITNHVPLKMPFLALIPNLFLANHTHNNGSDVKH